MVQNHSNRWFYKTKQKPLVTISIYMDPYYPPAGGKFLPSATVKFHIELHTPYFYK